MSFPLDFVWGAATASYQIEGAAREDGKGLSVWDVFCSKPGPIWNHETGDIACDHYHRHVQDVALIKQVGLKAYRFSASWPRILPNGTGAINDKGLDFYDHLVDVLLADGIDPWLTLFHWDYPYDLYQQSGWLNPDSSEWFADYVRVVVERLSDRVKHWITLNEPQVFLEFGHHEGRHAPGDRLELPQLLLAAHNVLLAHGKATQVIRTSARSKPTIGYSAAGPYFMPAMDAPADIEAARRAQFSIAEKNVWNATWLSDPIYLGHYPSDGLALFGADAPAVRAEDMATINQPLDLFAVNIYQGSLVRSGPNGEPENVPFPTGHPLTASRSWVTPDVMYWVPRFFGERYQKPVVITENGMSNVEWVSADGRVHDPQRIDFTRSYLLQLERAIDDQVDVRGYFHWSLMDNFEWADGYKERLGLVYVDSTSQKRILKDSATWYREVIQTNGAALRERA